MEFDHQKAEQEINLSREHLRLAKVFYNHLVKKVKDDKEGIEFDVVGIYGQYKENTNIIMSDFTLVDVLTIAYMQVSLDETDARERPNHITEDSLDRLVALNLLESIFVNKSFEDLK